MSDNVQEASVPSEVNPSRQRDPSGRFSLIDWIAVTSGTHTRWYLVAIVVLAALARIPFLDTIPNGFHNDEAIIGYDAYCILHTGADHYGAFLPIFARSNNVYNEALHRYFAAISIWIFGLNVGAVRLPMAVVGVLTVFLIYFFATELFGNKWTALLIAFLLAVSPWHITLTRVAFRAMLLPMFVVAALTCVLKGRREPRYFIWAGLIFGISLYTYHGARAFVPFLVLGLAGVFWSDISHHRKHFSIGAVIFTVFLLFFASYWLSPTGMEHQGNILFGGPTTWMANYWYNLSPAFLFVLGNQHGTWSKMILAPGLTPVQYFEIITMAIGVISLIKSWKHEYWLLVLWIAFYPLAASLTYQGSGYMLRLNTGPMLFATISGYGLWRIFGWLYARRRTWTIVVAVTIIAISITTSTYFYFVHQPKHVQKQWQYGVAEAFDVAKTYTSSDVYVSAGIWSAYMQTLFHVGFPPREAQTVMGSLLLPTSGYLIRITNVSFGRYHVRSEDQVLDEAALNEGSIAIVTPEDIAGYQLAGFRTVKRIDYSNGDTAYYVLQSMAAR